MRKVFIILMSILIFNNSIFGVYAANNSYDLTRQFLAGEISANDYKNSMDSLDESEFDKMAGLFYGSGASSLDGMASITMGSNVSSLFKSGSEYFDLLFSAHDAAVGSDRKLDGGGTRGGGTGGKYYTSSEASNGINEYNSGEKVFINIFDIDNNTYNEPDNTVNNYYDSHDIYDYTTINNTTVFTTVQEITINNYYTNIYLMSVTPRYTALTYFDGGGNVVTDKYYKELSDGRNTYDLTEDEVLGTIINYDYIPYKKVSENDGTMGLFHFNGVVQDDSYYGNTNFTYNGTPNYADSGNFHQSLIISSYGIDASDNVNFKVGFPQGYANTSKWTLEYRVNIPTIYQWDTSYVWKCNNSSSSTCSTEYNAYKNDYDSTSKNVVTFPGFSIISEAGGYDATYVNNIYKIDFKGSSIYNGKDNNSGKNFTFGLWHTVILQCDGTNVYVYLDGKKINTLTKSNVMSSGYFVFGHVQDELAPYYYIDEIRLSSGMIYGNVDSIPVTQNQFDSNKVYVLPDNGGYYAEAEMKSTTTISGQIKENGTLDLTSAEAAYLGTSKDYIAVEPITTYRIATNKAYRYYIFEYDANKQLIRRSNVINEKGLEYTTTQYTYFIKYSTEQVFTYSTCDLGTFVQDTSQSMSYVDSLATKRGTHYGTSYIDVKPSTSYTLKVINRGTWTWQSSSGVGRNYVIVFYNSNKEKVYQTGGTVSSNGATFNITTKDDTEYVRVIVYGDKYSSSTYYTYNCTGWSISMTALNCTPGITNAVSHKDFKFQIFGQKFYEEGLEETTIALKTEVPVTTARYGGVRPTYPSKGQVYFVTSNGIINQIQIYDGADWTETGGVIYLNGNWVSLYGRNLLDLTVAEDNSISDDDLYDSVLDNQIIIGDGSGGMGDENINNDKTIGNSLLGDLLSGFADVISTIGDILIGLFIPSEGFFNNFFDNLNFDFGSKLGFLNSTVDLFSQFINVFILSDDSSAPAALITTSALEFQGVELLPAMNIDLVEKVDELGFTDLYNMYLSCMDAYIVFRLFKLAGKKYEEVTSL